MEQAAERAASVFDSDSRFNFITSKNVRVRIMGVNKQLVHSLYAFFFSVQLKIARCVFYTHVFEIISCQTVFDWCSNLIIFDIHHAASYSVVIQLIVYIYASNLHQSNKKESGFLGHSIWVGKLFSPFSYFIL